MNVDYVDYLIIDMNIDYCDDDILYYLIMV